MKIKKMRIVGDEHNTGHHFDEGQEVILIQDFQRTPMGLNLFYKTCMGVRNDTKMMGSQTVASEDLEFVEYIVYPEVEIVDWFHDQDEPMTVADLGSFDEFEYDEEMARETLRRFQESLSDNDRHVPEALDEMRLVVHIDDDGDCFYTPIPDYYLV